VTAADGMTLILGAAAGGWDSSSGGSELGNHSRAQSQGSEQHDDVNINNEVNMPAL
jgi:hypothetical protein